MGTAAHPAFLRGAKTLLLLKLDGERDFGIVEELRHDEDGRAVFQVVRVTALSPADRAGITAGDQFLTVQVLGVDNSAFAWSDSALERIEQLHEICVVQICVKKHGDARITQHQQRRHDYFAQWLTKAKMLKISSKRFRGAFIPPQLQKVVVVLYDFEHANFARMWKALADDHARRAYEPLPPARAFVSETRLPGLVEDATVAAGRHWTPPAHPVAPAPASWKMSDMSTTESQVWSRRSPSPPPSPPPAFSKSEPPSSPRPQSETATESDAGRPRSPSVSLRLGERQRGTHRYLPYGDHKKATSHGEERDTSRQSMLQRLIGTKEHHGPTHREHEEEETATSTSDADDNSHRSESEEDNDEDWLPSHERRGRVMIKGEPSEW